MDGNCCRALQKVRPGAGSQEVPSRQTVRKGALLLFSAPLYLPPNTPGAIVIYRRFKRPPLRTLFCTFPFRKKIIKGDELPARCSFGNFSPGKGKIFLWLFSSPEQAEGAVSGRAERAVQGWREAGSCRTTRVLNKTQQAGKKTS